MPFLIDRLKEIGTPLDFEFLSRSPKITGKSKAGKYYDYYDYTFKIGGEVELQKIFARDHDRVLSNAKEHQICRATQSGDFANWSLIPFGEAALDIPGPSTYQSNKATKQYNGAIKEEAVSKILFGYMNTYLAQGKSPVEAADLAIVCHQEQERAVQHILSALNQ